MVRFSEIQQFSAFLETSQEISILFVPVSKFSEYLVEWKTPVVSKRKYLVLMQEADGDCYS